MRSFTLAVVAAAALAVACNSKTTMVSSPASPTAADDSNLNADGSNLKVSAPVPTSPVNDFEVEEAPTLIASAAAGKYASVSLQYEFEVYDQADVKIQSGVVSTPSFKTTITLDFDKRYTWRVRSTIPDQNATGPWSTVASFKSPVGGYIRAQELFDPLTNGKTIGRATDTTFTAEGIRLNSKHSYVEYVLPETLVEGEFSAIITNLGNGSEEWKTKVMSMLAGDGVNTTDNTYRLTLDKRSTWLGQPSPARFTFCVRPNCIEPNAGPQSWSRTHTYFWQFTWGGGVARLVILDGGTNGSPMVNLPGNYIGTYRPNPHLIRLGSVGGRVQDESNPGTVIRNVWVSAKPRPNFKGDRQ